MSTLIYIKYGTEENTKSRASSTSGHQEYQEDQDQNIDATYISDVVFLFLVQFNSVAMHLIYKVTYIMFHAKNTKNLRQWLLQICISSSFSMTLVSFSTNINNLIASLVSSKCSHFKVLNQLKMQSNETIWTPVSLNVRAESNYR